jgi:hypothetical protein
MTDWVRFPLPWHWEGEPALSDEELAARWHDLARWVNWFVARYHLAGQVPCCWPKHPGLVDELTALRYHHQEVTCPLVPMVQPDPVGSPQEPDDPGTSARAYMDWHETRWRWSNGPLRDAPGYRECLTRGEHVPDEAHHDDAQAFAEATTIEVGRLLGDAHEPAP